MGESIRGPMCSEWCGPDWIDDGTMCLARSNAWGPLGITKANTQSKESSMARANCSARDILGTLPVREVWQWYSRLALFVARRPVRGMVPLASAFLRRYLSPHSVAAGAAQPLFTFNAPDYLLNLSRVQDAQRYHRKVYLTQEQARIGQGRRWAGIRPRWQNPGANNWNRRDPLSMHYESLIEIPLSWQVIGNKEEKDILNSMGLGFQLRTDVVALVTQPGSDQSLNVVFQSFRAKIVDRYDFNYSEHLKMPNPDYQSTEAFAVCPRMDRIRVYHQNARRIEHAGLAAPYDLESQTWNVTDPNVSGPGRVTLS